MGRRTFTVDQKKQMLDEAESADSSFSEVARKYGVSTSQLYQWRAQLRGSVRPNPAHAPMSPIAADSLAAFELFVALRRELAASLERLSSARVRGELGEYNHSNALRSLTKAFVDLQSKKDEVLEWL